MISSSVKKAPVAPSMKNVPRKVEVPKKAEIPKKVEAPEDGNFVIGRMHDIEPSKLRPGEYTLPGQGRLPNQGSPKANWKLNFGEFRKELNKGKPFRDASAPDKTPVPIDGNPNRTIRQTFTGAEINAARNKGWTQEGEWWNPPKK